MKKILMVAVLAAMAATAPAHALSHKHAHKLAAQGCTQVQEAEGTCGKAPKVNEADAAAKAREWDRLHSQPGNAPTAAEHRDNLRHSSKYPMCADLPVDASNWDRKNCIE